MFGIAVGAAFLLVAAGFVAVALAGVRLPRFSPCWMRNWQAGRSVEAASALTNHSRRGRGRTRGRGDNDPPPSPAARPHADGQDVDHCPPLTFDRPSGST